jgi:hypothetical protein
MADAARIPACPPPVPPVAYRGRMVPQPGSRHRGYQAENHEWRDWLCDRDSNGNLVGKDPMTIPLDVLTASGHPYARAAAVIYRLRIMHGVDTGEARHDGFLGPQRGHNPFADHV